jgi:hypothetical protein
MLVGLRCQETLRVCRQGLECAGIGPAMDPHSSGLEALEHPGQCASLLADEGAPLCVEVDARNIMVQTKQAGHWDVHGTPRWPCCAS